MGRYLLLYGKGNGNARDPFGGRGQRERVQKIQRVQKVQRVVVAASPQFTASFHRKEVSPQATEDRGVNSFEKGS
jgi:hypothetical protein